MISHFIYWLTWSQIFSVVLLLQDTDAEHNKLKEQREALIKQMDALKAVLYAKFGKQINLENADQTKED